VIRRLYRWIDDRLGASDFTEHSLKKVFPDHWSFMLGEIALYCFVVLVVTGIFLGLFFDPTSTKVSYHGPYTPLQGVQVSRAYESVVNLSLGVRAGLVMRQIHHWAALVFIAAIVLHLCRIYFTGAFRRPREINWLIGVTLLLLGIFNGFTGYSMPDDLLSGTGLRIAYAVFLSVPVIGPWIAFLVFGGEFPANQIIGRLFFTHVFLIPAIIGALIGAHLAIIWRQKHTQFPGRLEREDNVVGTHLFPTYAAKSIGLFLGTFAVLAALGGLVQINPIWLYGPFRPEQVTSPAQPDWFLGWLEGALRMMPSLEIHVFGYLIPNQFFPAVLLPGLTFMLLYAWPFLEAFVMRDHLPHHILDRPRDRPLRTALGAATLTFYTVMFFAASNDLIAKWLAIPVDTVTVVFLVVLFAAPPVVAFVTYRLMKALRDSGAERFAEMPLRALSGTTSTPER
jgi:ubiquinol-cytochrome c reductase cytochrome b subunit